MPLLVVGTARPELLTQRPGWGGGKLNATTLALSPLSMDEAARLVAELLGRTLLPAETQAALLARAGGNPLYAEQYVRLFVERGTANDLPLPETVQGMIAARLDGLPPHEKALLQDAAVAGKVFWTGALQAIGRTGELDEALHSLAAKTSSGASGGRPSARDGIRVPARPRPRRRLRPDPEGPAG